MNRPDGVNSVNSVDGANRLKGAVNGAAPVVRPGSHLTLHYRVSLADSQSDVVSTFGQRPATIQLGLGQLAEALELVLLGMTEGERRLFTLDASQAYGDRNPALLQRLSRQLLDRSSEAGAQYELGDLLEFPTADGGRFAGVLKELDEGSALVDFNHPLAGHRINFEAEILGILE